ncbi:MAG: translation initiation factor IF-2 [Candidatus Eisenbacteria bacterium]|nr:translation initiation factor IF-2 [Candidatus Eisenbacteria bacterium]
MRKVRVYQLARELRLTNEALLDILREIDSSITTHAASVSGEVAEEIRQRLSGNAPRSAAAPAGEPVAQATVTAEEGTAQAAPARAVRRPAARVTPLQPTAPVWKLPRLPQAPDLSETLIKAKAAPATTPPPARRVGPVLPRSGRPGALPAEIPQPEAAAPGRTYYPSQTSRPGGRGRGMTIERGLGERDRAGLDRERGAVAPGGGAADTRPGRKGRKKKRTRREVDEREVLDSVRRTMATIDGTPRRRRRRRHEEGEEVVGEETRTIKASEFLTVAEFAALLGVRPAEVIAACLRLGIVANVNRRLDKDAIEAVADEFDYRVEFVKEFGEEILEEQEEETEAGDEAPRPVVVTVMGHVDHGKTKLLDYIRKTDVISRESGGITQHIGAYQVHLPSGGVVTFLDTPGHEAFTAMRARGADVTDLVILVVAADDGVNKQTVEAINHARAARKPIVVAINKCDLPNANPERIKKELSEHGLLVEEWGGETVAVEISAKQGTNVERLLEMLMLVAEMRELRAQPSRPAKGTVIEVRKDPGRGIVGTVLVQNGTLRIGDSFVCGIRHGKVRAMTDDLGERVEAAGPSTPVELLGWSDVPQVGDTLAVVKSESLARVIAGERSQIAREHRMKLASDRFRLDDLHVRIKEGQKADLRLIIKADVQGSAEVLRDSLEKLTSDQVSVVVVHAGVGKINESDVLLATASNAIIIGFQVRPDPRATLLAQSEGVEIRLYKVIYEAIDQVKDAMAGLLAPEMKERVLGSAEVREIFRVSKVGTVAGCHVITGLISRQALARVIRGEDVVWSGKISTLKRFKDDAREVQAGFDCGISLEENDDIQVGDLIEAYAVEEVARSAAAETR